MSVKKLVRAANQAAYVYIDQEGFEWVNKSNPHTDIYVDSDDHWLRSDDDDYAYLYNYTHGGPLFRAACDLYRKMYVH